MREHALSNDFCWQLCRRLNRALAVWGPVSVFIGKPNRIEYVSKETTIHSHLRGKSGRISIISKAEMKCVELFHNAVQIVRFAHQKCSNSSYVHMLLWPTMRTEMFWRVNVKLKYHYTRTYTHAHRHHSTVWHGESLCLCLIRTEHHIPCVRVPMILSFHDRFINNFGNLQLYGNFVSHNRRVQ